MVADEHGLVRADVKTNCSVPLPSLKSTSKLRVAIVPMSVAFTPQLVWLDCFTVPSFRCKASSNAVKSASVVACLNWSSA